MRAERLVAALLLMQARGRVTAAELARELEVSVATARRDLEALSAAGIPVYPQAGRGGGWSLVGGARTDLSGLTSAEAQALFALVGPAADVVPEARAALRKLVRALPDTFRDDAEAAARAVVVDAAAWGADGGGRPAEVGVLQDAVVRRRRVRFAYANWAGERSDRLVDPWGLVAKDDRWYLVAGTPGGRRTFRVDRMGAVAATDEPFDLPDGFTLGDEWDEVVAEVERRRATTAATVRVPARLLPALRAQFGRHCPPGDDTPDADGRVTVAVTAPTPIAVAAQLAGWGGAIDVTGPPEVRAELARLGAELVAAHAAAAPPS